ncbi:uncharacterized protein LOC131040138 [Cryptomeria japonica]|uniref:uncharacterized protein LOC131040138 n=1 Tax=Cryptomeria japonica TaxID=3369 RepID=UPI0027DA17CC|nr:uncharacterized protein LOC131040138 [Cryptomeria japonica]
MKFEPFRNDDKVNSYNRYILQLWRENIDWQLVMSKHVVTKYIAKYAAKAEKSSETYHQMLLWLANVENSDDLAAKAYRRLLTETLIERDIGAQETSHMLLELPLVQSSRRFINLNVSREVFKCVDLNTDDDNEEHTISFIDAYRNMPQFLEVVCLIDAAKSWIYKRRGENKWSPRKAATIVRVFPRFQSIPACHSEKWIDFCSSELLLYKPFHEIHTDIGHNDESIVATWDNFRYNQWHLERRGDIENSENEADSESKGNNAQGTTTKNEWEILSRLHHGQIMEVLEIDMLGRRDIDRQTGWCQEFQGEQYTNEATNFINIMRNSGCLIHGDIPQCVDYGNLSDKQNKVVNIIMSHYHTYQNVSPLYMIIQGTTRTGKSYLIGTISQTLQNAASPKCSPLLLLAPTGVVAFNIGASTIHSKLRIPIKNFSELQGTRLTTFQEEISHIKYILLDEMSFLGEMLLENIDSRLRQAFLENSHKSFGGISMILVGDLAQLPHVKDRAAYERKRHARILWEEFKTVVTLSCIFRQDGQSNEQEIFRLLLTNIRDANPTIDDWMLLMSRSNGNMSIETNNEFKNSVHLFSTNDNVHSHNKRKLYSLKNPIARSIAVKRKTISSIERDGNDEFDMELLLNKNARVMLTSNLWIEEGLVNGPLGYIQSIVYRPGSAPPLPLSYILVDFDGYSGIPFDDRHPQRVPIPAIDKASTKQIPLRLAWALTIHKSEGLTLDKATIDIDPIERSGLTIVAISRVKSLQGLRIMPPFTYDRYEKMKRGKQQILGNMDVSQDESEIIVQSPTASVNSKFFVETPIDKCVRIFLECCNKIVKEIENTSLIIDDVEEHEILKMEDVAKKAHDASAIVSKFPYIMKEVYFDHLVNKGRNTILITEEFMMYLHHYNKVIFM